jgi:histone H1/5
MSDKDKAKPSKSVMGNLPSTRPTRMARRRDGEPVSGNGETEAEARPKTAAKTAKKPTRATPKAVGKPAGKAAPRTKPKAAGSRPKAAATKAASGSKPRAVRSGSPSLDAAKKKPRARRVPAPEPPKGAELVTTAVQATGELAKIGLTLGSQALKRAARKLPKP